METLLFEEESLHFQLHVTFQKTATHTTNTIHQPSDPESNSKHTPFTKLSDPETCDRVAPKHFGTSIALPLL
jgi:hypothetical protein